jgi:hypothetical protein
MIISHKYKFIFIKTRKTAGSSIEKYLSNYLSDNDVCTGSLRDETPSKNIAYGQNGHNGWRTIAKKYPIEWQNYFKFAVERNPWDRAVSMYYWHLNVKPHQTKRGFEEYVCTRKFDSSNDVGLYTEKGRLKVDLLIPYEKLHEVLQVTKEIPYNNEMLHTFVKSGMRIEKDYKDLHTEKTYNRIVDLYNWQINYFNYRY